ncbi:MAG: adenylosuccinate lyase [Calditrichaeota bacterium]|nr:adenylosuccinate lyase [Calditrichota bacterium]
MIPRYTRPEMGQLWSDETKFQTWLEVEILACEAWSELGEIPREAVDEIKRKARFDVQRILEIEAEVHHDVIAFLTNVAENVGPASRYIHYGMTSSDLLDTSLAVLLRRAGQMLYDGLAKLREAVGRRALEHKNTLCVARTHGVHSEPITFGWKLAVWYDELRRHLERLERAIDTVSVGKISGAVGTWAYVDPFVEKYVCEKLGLKPAPASTQVVQRDRHAEFLSTLALIGNSLEKFAIEIRHLQRTEVLEVEEPFGKKQKGSSAMPHKKNPITCERIAGQARVLRANALAAMENVALWHERDISHSSVERVIIPDSTILLDYMLATFTRVVDGLVVYPERMRQNLDLTGGLIYSQAVLLLLAKKGLTREEAYSLVQSLAMKARETGQNFREVIESDPKIAELLTPEELAWAFDPAKNVRRVDEVFERVGLSERASTN